ncbi:hypothetical protein B5M09_009385 [Aphanomyces astaci]|uniref:Uncharacterized protein n=1 Tax=Aphanomyces astaci TaxID=112090 RepID=A0A3R7YJM7_APHAT|nr:hypothetical protein B5M09_009385 [Aphanomyces astaci]
MKHVFPVAHVSTVALVAILAAATVSAATPVSICQDATYSIAGSICSGNGLAPVGQSCPRVGDVATKDCHPYLPSWDAKTSTCILKEDSVCTKLASGAWGCVLPSIGCGQPAKKKNSKPFDCDASQSAPVAVTSWEFSENDSPSLATASAASAPASWFVASTAKVQYEVGCLNSAKFVKTTTTHGCPYHIESHHHGYPYHIESHYHGYPYHNQGDYDSHPIDPSAYHNTGANSGAYPCTHPSSYSCAYPLSYTAPHPCAYSCTNTLPHNCTDACP